MPDAPDPNQWLASLNELEARSNPDADRNHRLFKRYPIRAEAELTPMSRNGLSQDSIMVQIRDLGRGGVGFLSEQPLTIHSMWQMTFLTNGYSVASQGIMVRHNSPVQGGAHLIGAGFILGTGTLVAMGIDPGEIGVEDHRLDETSWDEDQFTEPEAL